jgi:hypothetical protein
MVRDYIQQRQSELDIFAGAMKWTALIDACSKAIFTALCSPERNNALSTQDQHKAYCTVHS